MSVTDDSSVKEMLVENRSFSEPRQRVIASSPALQERAAAKTRMLIGALASALCERGVPGQQANLAAQVGMATLSHAAAAWFEDDSRDLSEYIVGAFQEVRDLSSSSPSKEGIVLIGSNSGRSGTRLKSRTAGSRFLA